MGRIGAAFRRRRSQLALLASNEMGKPLAESLAEVDKCAWACDWFAHDAPAMLEPVPADTGALRAEVEFDPRGVLFAIMPWNFPYWQVVRALAPALVPPGTWSCSNTHRRPPAAHSRCATSFTAPACTTGFCR